MNHTPRIMIALCLIVAVWQPALAQRRDDAGEGKSGSTALRYSAFGTGIPVAIGSILLLSTHGGDSDEDIGALIIGINIGALGAVVGPGFGHAYAGRWWHLAEGSLIRMVGAAVLISGIVGHDPSGMGGWGDPNYEDKGSDGAAIVIGGAIYLWSAIHDFKTLDDAVNEYNQNHTRVSLSVSPRYLVTEKTVGLTVRLSF